MILRIITCLFLVAFVFSVNIPFADCDELSVAKQKDQENRDEEADLILMSSWYIWEQRSFQAYTEEKPEIAIWALKNYADILQEDSKYVYDNSELERMLRVRLIITHGRIALTYQKIANHEMFEHHIAKFFKHFHEHKKGSNEKIYSIDELVNFIKRADAISRNWGRTTLTHYKL